MIIKTKVTDIIKKTEYIFLNKYSLIDNLISTILYIQNKSGKLTNLEQRKEIVEKYDIRESISTVTGEKFAYCYEFNLYSKKI
jgi:hypothetical protein